MFFQFPMSLKLFRYSATPSAESRGGCEPQRQFPVETHEGNKMLIHTYGEEEE